MKNKIFAAGALLALAICTCFSYKHAPVPPTKEEQILEWHRDEDSEKQQKKKQEKLENLTDTEAVNYENDIYAICKVNIKTEPGEGYYLLKEDGYTDAEITITMPDETIVNEISSGKVKVRGNSTSIMPKRPYTVKFDKKQNLFGMGKAKKWNLLANAYDPTLLRNFLALGLARDMKLPGTPECKMAEVIVDERYMGTYLLTEAIEVRKGRLELDIKNGDFLVEVDAYQREEGDHIPYGPAPVIVHTPEEPTEEEFQHICDTYRDAMYTAEYGTFDEIKEKIDVEEMARFLVFNEYVKTVDFGFSSTFFYYTDGKLHAGPVWDYDGSMGLMNPDINKAYVRAVDTEASIADRAIFYYLTAHDEFNELVKEAYIEYRPMFEELYTEGGKIDLALLFLQPYMEMDFSPAVWNKADPTANWDYMRTADPTYIENVEYLRAWLKKRIEGMDKYYGIR